jgi:hypothetical protein
MRALLVTGDYSALGKDIFALLLATAAMILIASLSFRKLLS